MTASSKIEVIQYGLNHLHINGRTSLECLLSAIRSLSSWDGLQKNFNYKAVQTALDSVVVCGEEDINHLLACIQMLDELIEEEKNLAEINVE